MTSIAKSSNSAERKMDNSNDERRRIPKKKKVAINPKDAIYADCTTDASWCNNENEVEM